MCHRSRPVYYVKKCKVYKICHRSTPVELCEKNARIYKMCHMSGPVELCEKMLEYIKCATGPDLWNYVKKFWNI